MQRKKIKNLFEIIADVKLQLSKDIKIEEYPMKIDSVDRHSFIISLPPSKLIHISEKNQIISQLQVKNKFIETRVINQRQILILCKVNKVNEFIIWNLKSKQNKVIKYQQFHGNIGQKIFFFNSKQIICLCEWSDKKVRLSYFQLPLTEQSIPFHVDILKRRDGDTLAKLNQQSMIGLINNKQNRLLEDKIRFKTYFFDFQTKKGVFQQYELQNPLIFKHKKFHKSQIYDIWQINHLKFLIQLKTTIVEQSESKLIYYNWVDQKGWQSRLNSKLSKMFQIQFVQNLRISDEIIYSYQKLKDQNQIFYVDTQMEQVIGVHPFFNRDKQRIVSWPGYSNCQQIIQYEKFSSGNFDLTLFKPPNQWRLQWQQRAMLSVFLLRQSIKDCDEDLLYQICYMCEPKEQN